MKKTYIKELATALSSNHAALMVGAGFSKNAEKLSATDKIFLSWNELSDEFFSLIYGDANNKKTYCSSLRLAQEVETVLGRPKLETILKEAIPDLDYGPSELHKNLMELPWVDVFTTNYDTLLERAADTVTSRRYNVVVSQEDLINSNDAPRIIKLHGSFPSNRPFIITEEDYRTYPYKFAAFVNTVQQALLENVFCMVGFSCEDSNFVKWIGWIHDNLGKSSSHKIYMISVMHVSEARTKLLSEQNIIVVDLEELYPSAKLPNRIQNFLNDIKTEVDQNNFKGEWFRFDNIYKKISSNIYSETNVLRELNTSYPGWIFLPWKMKKRVNHILLELERNHNYNDGSDEEQISYIFEYLKFIDIVGRPLLSERAKIIFKKITSPGLIIDTNDYRLQYIRLQLMRTFRELAQWENYEICKSGLREDLLSYEDKQFYFACEWWKSLYRFDAEGLTEKLGKWTLSKGDLYWPLIKASMYAIVGDFSKAEEILSQNLVLVRQKLFKSNKKEYLSSIEDSCVSLINFIRQRNFSEIQLEKSVNNGGLSWWEENDKYCLCIDSKDKEEKNSITTNFDLTDTYITHLVIDNEKTLYALDYLRFIEQSGHPFRLGNVTNTKGLEGTLIRLVPYYPHCCLMHTLIAQDDKHLDLFFGRVQLAVMSQENIDEVVDEYVQIIKVLHKNVDPSNFFSATSVYEHAATIVLKIVARLCYKCSVEKLDEVLNILLDICRGPSRANFRGFKQVFTGLLNAYSEEQLRERVNKILLFPITSDRLNEYIDPIQHVSLNIENPKTTLEAEIYENTLYEIKKILASGSEEQKRCAISRLVIMCQFLEVHDSDKHMLCELLEKRNVKTEKELLYFLKTDCQKQMAIEIFNNTIASLKQDAEAKSTFTEGAPIFGHIFDVLNNIDITTVDYLKTVEVIKRFVQKNCDWASEYDYPIIKDRIYTSFLLLVRLTMMKDKLTASEKQIVSDTLSIFETHYSSSLAIKLIEFDFIEDNGKYDDQKLQEDLWLTQKNDIHLLEGYYNILKASDAFNSNLKVSYDFWNRLFNFSVYKLCGGVNEFLLPSLKLCYSLLELNIPTKDEISLLLTILKRMTNITTISEDKSENDAIYCLKCRICACKIAQILYRNGIEGESIISWKELSENKNEFSEIRKINFSQ